MSWKGCARRDPCEISRQCQIIFEFFQHIKQLLTIRCLQKNSQSISTAPTVISANIECLIAFKTSMLSEMCKREHCHYLCIQETHRAPHVAMPKIPGMTLIAEPPHIKYGSAIFIRSDLKVKDVSEWEQDNVELISSDMPGVVVHSVYKPPNEKFILPARGHGHLSHIVIGDINSHSTT